MERAVRGGVRVSGGRVEERGDVGRDGALAPEAHGLCVGLVEVLLVGLALARAQAGLERLLFLVWFRERAGVGGAPGVGLLDEEEREGDVGVFGGVECGVVDAVGPGLQGGEGLREP